jgi:hypothetical protein
MIEQALTLASKQQLHPSLENRQQVHQTNETSPASMKPKEEKPVLIYDRPIFRAKKHDMY